MLTSLDTRANARVDIDWALLSVANVGKNLLWQVSTETTFFAEAGLSNPMQLNCALKVPPWRAFEIGPPLPPLMAGYTQGLRLAAPNTFQVRRWGGFN